MSKKSKNREHPPDKVVVAQEKPDEVEPEPGVDELKAQLQRLGADFQNYQKRSHRQIEQTHEFAQENLLRALLPALDNFEHTLEKGCEAQDVAAVVQGVQIVFDHLRKVLEGVGMQRIEVQPGTAFDPNLHEAMLHEPSDEYPEQTIVRELAPGYQMNGRTLRPAKVSVAKAPPNEDDNPQKDEIQTEEGSEDADV